jgi:hypothetical protein
MTHNAATAAGGTQMPAGLVSLVAHGVLDDRLGATVWLLLEGGCPLVVASAGPGRLRRLVLDALTPAYPPSRRRVPVAVLEPADAADAVAIAGDIGGPPFDPALARAVSGAATVLDRGLALALGLESGSLEEVLEALVGPGVHALRDRLSYLGLVLVLEEGAGDRPEGAVRVAHYLRPLSRDAGGHVQRLPPAVVAARDATTGRLEDFSWGIVAELATRVGRTPADFESEVERRRDLLSAAVAGHRP